MEKEAEEKIQQLQLIEQNMQNLMLQKQSIQVQLMESESAISELSKVDNAYKIVGNIMVQADKKELLEELNSKKETSALRIKTIESSEEKLKAKAQRIQSEVLGKIRKDES